MDLLIVVSSLALVGFLGMPVLRFIFTSSTKLLWFALQGIVVLVLGSLIYKFGFLAVVLMIISVPFILYGVGYLFGRIGYGLYQNIRSKWELGNSQQGQYQPKQSKVSRFFSEDDDFDMSGVRHIEPRVIDHLD